MTLISLRAVDARPLEQVVFGASIGIPLPETLEEMHNYSLRGGVLAHRDLCLGCDLNRNIHPGGADVMIMKGAVMAWYEIINAKSDSYIADRDAEDMLRQLATALQTADAPVDTEVFYGLTSNGARRYYVSLSPEAVELAERVLASYDARELTASPDLTGMEQIRRR